jgi:uncharacterized protein DUF4231/conflict system pore-forming effector with SLATT domain
MIETAWDEYRGWANRARSLQAAAQRWSLAAMAAALLAAIFGAAAGQATNGTLAARILTFLAAVAAAVTPILGRDILEVKREAGWIRARSTAETIKSECFRYAAGLGDYAGPGADSALATRLQAIAEPALQEGLRPLPDPARGRDDRRPQRPMEIGWYVEHRLAEQRDGFYARGQRRHEQSAALLRGSSLGLAILAAVLGVAGTSFGVSSLGPWIAVITTAGALIVAQGLMDRRHFLAATFGAMVIRLSRIEARLRERPADLVKATEDELEREHAAWTERMTKHIPAPSQVQEPPTHG